MLVLNLGKKFRVFVLLALPLMSLVGDFKQERKVQTHIKVYQHAFGYKPIDSEVIWWLEFQSHAYTHRHYFLCLCSETEMEQSNCQIDQDSRVGDPIAWME